MSDTGRRSKDGRAALGVAALAVACCAGMPLLLAGVAAIGLSFAAGGLAVARVVALVVVGALAQRRRGATRPPKGEGWT